MKLYRNRLNETVFSWTSTPKGTSHLHAEYIQYNNKTEQKVIDVQFGHKIELHIYSSLFTKQHKQQQ